jgi:integrase
MRDNNRPAKGSTITVDPIRSKAKIADIKRLLAADNPRDSCLFTVGINTALRASDLVRLTVGQVSWLKPGDLLRIAEQKTSGRKAPRPITWNQAAADAVAAWLPQHPAGNRASTLSPLFPSQKRGGGGDGDLAPITGAHVHRLIKSWCRRVGLQGNYGSHSLRKTWGYHQRVTFGTDLAVIMQAYGHSRPAITMRYLGIQPSEVETAYLHTL